MGRPFTGSCRLHHLANSDRTGDRAAPGVESFIVRYVYSVVRFVPDAARGEFVNLAVIAGSDETGEWKARRVQDISRAAAFAGADSEPLIESVFEWLDLEMEHLRGNTDQNAGEQYLTDFAERCYRGYNQLTPPAPMLAADVDEALDWAFATKVVEPDAA